MQMRVVGQLEPNALPLVARDGRPRSKRPSVKKTRRFGCAHLRARVIDCNVRAHQLECLYEN